MTKSTVIATRQSRLAMWQAEHVRVLLQSRFNLHVELLGVVTRGDQILDQSLSELGGKGLFIKELELALQDGRAQLAVHSLKDVPMDLPPGFVLAAILEREDARDAMLSKRYATLNDLPAAARVGTSSLRRATQLHALRPDLRVEPLRGNLDTRLRKLDEGHYDAIVLAAAGLNRLGLAERIRFLFDPMQLLPAAGQGALAIEVRNEALGLRQQLAQLTHNPTWLAVNAERAVSRALGGNCSMPLAAYAAWREDGLQLDVALGHPQHSAAPLLRASVRGPVSNVAAAEALGQSAAQLLRERGASNYL